MIKVGVQLEYLNREIFKYPHILVLDNSLQYTFFLFNNIFSFYF